VDLLCVFSPRRLSRCGGAELVKKPKKVMMLLKVMAMLVAVQGGGSPGPSFEDFPSAEGHLPIQGLSGGAAPARHRCVLPVGVDIGVLLGFSVIFCLVWTFL
jgi:hypothetical protein